MILKRIFSKLYPDSAYQSVSVPSKLSSFNCLHSFFCHLFGIFLPSHSFYPINAGISIRVEKKTKQLTYNVCELLAIGHISRAFCAGFIPFFHATSTRFAPSCFFVFQATHTTSLQILPASTTIETTYSNQFLINFNRFFHALKYLKESVSYYSGKHFNLTFSVRNDLFPVHRYLKQKKLFS